MGGWPWECCDEIEESTEIIMKKLKKKQHIWLTQVSYLIWKIERVFICEAFQDLPVYSFWWLLDTIMQIHEFVLMVAKYIKKKTTPDVPFNRVKF